MNWDETAFTEHYNRLYPELCRFLECLLAGASHDAPDLAQEAFLQLHRQGPADFTQDGLRFWLLRVGRNLALNRLKQQQIRSGLLGKFADFFRPKSGSDQHRHLEQAQTHHRLSATLAALPPHQRTVLILREQQDLAYDEIARILGCSQGKVKSDLHRARNQLRKVWTQQEPKTMKGGTYDGMFSE